MSDRRRRVYTVIRLQRAAGRIAAAKERGDLVAMADARTSAADARTAIGLARGVDPDDITSLGLSISRDAYEHSRESWQRVHRDDPSSEYTIRGAHAARARWLDRRPEWTDDWGIHTTTPADPGATP